MNGSIIWWTGCGRDNPAKKKEVVMENTWPGGIRHAMDQDEHESWNAEHYPGTLEICVICEQPTGQCEEDSIYFEDTGPLCGECNLTLETR